MNREELIDWLVDDLLKSIQEDAEHGDYGMLADYLREGFCGFEKYSDSELKEEYEERVWINAYIKSKREAA